MAYFDSKQYENWSFTAEEIAEKRRAAWHRAFSRRVFTDTGKRPLDSPETPSSTPKKRVTGDGSPIPAPTPAFGKLFLGLL